MLLPTRSRPTLVQADSRPAPDAHDAAHASTLRQLQEQLKEATATNERLQKEAKSLRAQAQRVVSQERENARYAAWRGILSPTPRHASSLHGLARH